MKALFITRKYPPQKGGMELYSYNLISNYNHDKKVLKLCKKQIHLLWFFPYCFFYILLFSKKFDVIELGDMLLCGIGWAAKKLNPKLKVVVTIHGLDITYKNKFYQYYLRVFSKHLDIYIPNSTYTEKLAEDKGYNPIKKIYPATLAKCCDKELDSGRVEICRKYGLRTQSKILLTTGRLIERKGVEWFVTEVFPLLKSYDINYLVVGEGVMKCEIEKAVNKLNTNKIKLLGKVNDLDLKELYSAADIFVMPNIYVKDDVEGYGMVAIEAMAAKCIVIAAGIQGIKDAVIDGENGYLVEAGNAYIFAKKIMDVLDNIDNYKEFTLKAKEYVYKNCTGKVVAEQYYEVFSNLLNNRT